MGARILTRLARSCVMEVVGCCSRLGQYDCCLLFLSVPVWPGRRELILLIMNSRAYYYINTQYSTFAVHHFRFCS